jgi:hypothetical protein
MAHTGRRLALAGLIPIVGVIGFVAGNRVFSQIYHNVAPWRPLTVRPFVAHITKRSYSSPDDTKPRVVPEVYGRRSDRSTVAQMPAHLPNGSVGGTLVWITDTAHRQQIMLEPFTRSKTTETYTDDEFAAIISANLDENCPAAVPVGRPPAEGGGQIFGGTFFGHAAVYSLNLYGNRSGRSGTFEVERWTLTDLNCYPVKEISTRGTMRVEAQVDSLTELEPPSNMFNIPEGYTERSPLEMEAAYKERFGAGFYGEQIVARLEARYQRPRR